MRYILERGSVEKCSWIINSTTFHSEVLWEMLKKKKKKWNTWSYFRAAYRKWYCWMTSPNNKDHRWKRRNFTCWGSVLVHVTEVCPSKRDSAKEVSLQQWLEASKKRKRCLHQSKSERWFGSSHLIPDAMGVGYIDRGMVSK